MITLVRTELLQLRTLRSTYIAAGALLALILAVTAATMADAGTKGLSTPAELRDELVASVGIVSAIFLALLGALRVAGEYRYATIAQRVLSEPRRLRVLVAKTIAYCLVAALVAAVVFGLAVAIAVPLASAKDLTLGLSAADLVDLGSRICAGAALFAALGVAIGFITRSQPAVVVAVFGTFFAEKILASVIGGGTAYLPFGLLESLLAQTGALSPSAAALGLALIVTASSGLAATLLARRDVTA